MHNLLLLLVVLPFIGTITSCEDAYQSHNKIEVYVTQNGEIPDQYDLRIYRGDKLVKSDEFDREYRRTNNLTEVLDPVPGLYYFEARSGSLWARDSMMMYDFSKVIIVNVELKK